MRRYDFFEQGDSFSVKELDEMNKKLEAWLLVHEEHKSEGSMNFRELNKMHFGKNKKWTK